MAIVYLSSLTFTVRTLVQQRTYVTSGTLPVTFLVTFHWLTTLDWLQRFYFPMF